MKSTGFDLKEPLGEPWELLSESALLRRFARKRGLP